MFCCTNNSLCVFCRAFLFSKTPGFPNTRLVEHTHVYIYIYREVHVLTFQLDVVIKQNALRIIINQGFDLCKVRQSILLDFQREALCYSKQLTQGKFGDLNYLIWKIGEFVENRQIYNCQSEVFEVVIDIHSN